MAFQELDPALLVAELNQVDNVASVLVDTILDVKSFKLRATNVKDMALEIKDFLGRSEYNHISIQTVIIEPDRQAEAGDRWIDGAGVIHEYTESMTVKGMSLVRATMELRP